VRSLTLLVPAQPAMEVASASATQAAVRQDVGSAGADRRIGRTLTDGA
jgi:hypothetical protein